MPMFHKAIKKINVALF